MLCLSLDDTIVIDRFTSDIYSSIFNVDYYGNQVLCMMKSSDFKNVMFAGLMFVLLQPR